MESLIDLPSLQFRNSYLQSSSSVTLFPSQLIKQYPLSKNHILPCLCYCWSGVYSRQTVTSANGIVQAATNTYWLHEKW